MAGIDNLLSKYKTACGNTVNIGDTVMSKYGCYFYVIDGIELNNKTGEVRKSNGRVLLKHYRSDNQYRQRVENLESYYLVKDGVMTLKP
jgi:hypothetical protein